jgi:hypothetical protein
LPANWTARVNEAQSPAELKALRESVNRQRPYGGREWAERAAGKLQLSQSLAPLGRPKKKQSA